VLAAEIARHSDEVRDAYTAGVLEFVELAASHWKDASREEAVSRAMALYGLMAGTMQVARATTDGTLSREIMESGLRAALTIARQDVERIR